MSPLSTSFLVVCISFSKLSSSDRCDADLQGLILARSSIPGGEVVFRESVNREEASIFGATGVLAGSYMAVMAGLAWSS